MEARYRRYKFTCSFNLPILRMRTNKTNKTQAWEIAKSQSSPHFKKPGLGFGHFRTQLKKTQALEMTCIQGWILG